MSIMLTMPSNHLILCWSPSPLTLSLSQHQGLFQWVGSSHEVTKVLSFSFSISPSNEHPGLVSFRMDWLDILAVQGTLKSLLQHHSSKASILWHSAFRKSSAGVAGDLNSIWFGKFPWRRKWQPTPVFLLGESHGQRSLAGYSSWDPKSRTWLGAVFPFSLWSNFQIHTLEKTIALTWWTFVSKVIVLLFNMLSSFIITFLPRSTCLLIHHLQWFWSPGK